MKSSLFSALETQIILPTTSADSWKTPDVAQTKPHSNVLVIVLVVTIAILAIIIIAMIAGGAVYFKRRHRQGSNRIEFGQNPSSTITFHQGANPTVCIGAEGSSTQSHPQYSKQSPTYGNVVHQYACEAAPSKSSIQYEELQKPLLHA